MNNYASPFSGLGSFDKDMLNASPDTAYQRWLTGGYGLNPANNQRQFNYGDSLYNYYQKDYYNQSVSNHGLSWTDYLDKLGNTGKGVGSMWDSLSPNERGENPGLYQSPARWVG